MGFLHRLHPDRIAEPGAARPDVAPMFAPRHQEPGLLPEPQAPVAVAPAAAAVHRAAPVAAAVVAPKAQAIQAMPAAPAAPAETRRPSPAAQTAPRTEPTEQRRAQTLPPAPPAASPVAERIIERLTERETRVTTAAAPVVAGALAPPAPQRPQAAAASAPWHPAQRAFAPAAPLRAEAVVRAPAATPPTVVQVSIDRIDVRLPAEHVPAQPPAARRPRTAAGAPSLVEYLRGGSGGRR